MSVLKNHVDCLDFLGLEQHCLFSYRYVDILLRQVSTGNLLYSPNRRSFITKTATTNFKADEFTDPVGKQLQHLGSDMYRMALICCIDGMLWYTLA